VGAVAERLKELIERRCSEINAEIIEIEVMPDHVHLLIEVDPQFGINRAVRSIKGFSSHTLRQEFPSLKTRLPTLWTNSYFVSTVGGAPLEIIRQYIENQERTDRRVRHGKGV
jgi:putative transposase